MYRKCISKRKTHPAHMRYAKYINIYNKFKQSAKTTYYANQLNTLNNDSKICNLQQNNYLKKLR